MKIEFWKMLNESEQEEVRNYSAKIHWGFNENSIREQFNRYMNGDLKEKAKVCFLLEDCKFHELCGYLAEGMVADAKKWINDEFPLEDGSGDDNIQEVEAWIMEGSKGNYLHINSTEDGNGTWFDWTVNVFESYWVKSLEDLKNIAETEFSDFEENYPKFHKVRFTAEVLETSQSD